MNAERLCYYLENILNIPIHQSDASGLNETENLRMEKVAIKQEENGSCYGIVAVDQEIFYFLGPVQFEQKRIKNAHVNGYYCDFRRFVTALLMLREYFTGEAVNYTEIVMDSEIEEQYRALVERERPRYHFQQQENQWLHNSFAQERREQKAIRDGDLQKFLDAVDEPVIGKLGVNSEDRLRSVKNNAISLMAISVRSAMEGGLDGEKGYQLCDTYISQIEKMDDVDKIIYFCRNAQKELIKHVHLSHLQEKEMQSPYVEKCKDYIYKHMHESISAEEIADWIGVTANYLSMVFRRDEGITIKEYMMREKIYYTKNMLIYSEYSINDIAQYFGFSSQSHFGSVFKRIVGTTPLEFRKQNQIKNFF